MTAALAAAGFDAALTRQSQSTQNTICALLGWVPMIIAAVMLTVAYFNPIEKETVQMERSEQ